MFRLFRSIKCELEQICESVSRIIIFGLLLLSLALVVIYAASSPVYIGRFGVLKGGTFSVLLCYFSSVIFFFLCGVIFALAYSSKTAHPSECPRIFLDVAIAYVFRILWIVLFFGGFSPLLSLVCLTASAVFIVFAIINTVNFSSIMTVILALMLIFSLIFIIFTLKFISFN